MRNVYVSVRSIKSKTKAGDSLAGKKHTSGEMHLRTKVKVEIVKKISQKKFPLKVRVIFSAEDHRSNIFVPVSASGNFSTHSWTIKLL